MACPALTLHDGLNVASEAGHRAGTRGWQIVGADRRLVEDLRGAPASAGTRPEDAGDRYPAQKQTRTTTHGPCIVAATCPSDESSRTRSVNRARTSASIAGSSSA